MYENGGAGAGEHVVNNFNLVQEDLGSFSEEVTLKLTPEEWSDETGTAKGPAERWERVAYLKH